MGVNKNLFITQALAIDNIRNIKKLIKKHFLKFKLDLNKKTCILDYPPSLDDD